MLPPSFAKRFMPLLLITAIAMAHASTAEWTVTNPTGRTFHQEPLRLPFVPTDGEAVLQDGRQIDHQLVGSGTTKQAYVLVDAEPGARMVFSTGPHNGEHTESPGLVALTQKNTIIEITNDCYGIRLPDSASEAKAPILAVRGKDGEWVGQGSWHNAPACTKLESTVLAAGPLFISVRLLYQFANDDFAQIDITVLPGRPYARIQESHRMPAGSAWQFDCARGWAPTHPVVSIHSSGADGSVGIKHKNDWTLKPGQTRMGDRLVQLMPRWTQHYDQGWYFGVDDGAQTIGALVVRPSLWVWPHDNLIDVVVKKSGDAAILRCPTRRGQRYWLLLAGPAETFAIKKTEYKDRKGRTKTRTSNPMRGLVDAEMQSLNKINHHFITDWPEVTKGGYAYTHPYSDKINPTGFWRSLGSGAIKGAGKKLEKANRGTLIGVQTQFDPDCYGSYWNFWSPENPNFFTDFIKRPFGDTANLKNHPQFKTLKTLALFKLREDLHHSVTLPGGAGQECPGYVCHALHGWMQMAEVAKEHFDVDPVEEWPYIKAATSFVLHCSQPIGADKRRIHPGGDTHPPGKDVIALGQEVGVSVDFTTLTSEESPGFGAFLRHRCGSERETYIAFKAGPNRGHFHGDQLSIHYCANSKPLAIDHMCSYSPRAGQEHMHNRVAFSVDGMPHANMDGYERLIAFKTSAVADIAVAQVESNRLRRVKELPPETWDQRWDVQPLDKTLRYRRTLVLVKGDSDYLVIRDQYDGPSVVGTYFLHVLGDKAELDPKTSQVRFDDLTLFVRNGAPLAQKPFDWSYRKGKSAHAWTEATRSVPFANPAAASGEFITVLYPDDKAPAISAVDGGVQVGNDIITFSGGIDAPTDTPIVTVQQGDKNVADLNSSDIDLNRSQGSIGLFVPDAGYPFGDIPQWLIDQRSPRPEWYGAYQKKLGTYWAP